MRALRIVHVNQLMARYLIAAVVVAVLVVVAVGVHDFIKAHIRRTKQSEDSKSASILQMRSLAKALVDSLHNSGIADWDGMQRLKRDVEQISEDLRYLSPSTNDTAAALDGMINMRLQELNMRVERGILHTTDVIKATEATQEIADLIVQRKAIRD